MGAVIVLSVLVVTLLVGISVCEARRDNECLVTLLWFLVGVAVMLGAGIDSVNTVSASKYLEHPENYKVDTFMKNGDIYRFEVSKKK